MNDTAAADGAATADAPASPAEAGGMMPDGGAADAVGACGSQITFHIGVGPDVDPAALCSHPCDGVSTVLRTDSLELAVGPFLAPGMRALWSPVQADIGCVVLCDGCSRLLCPPCFQGMSLPAGGWDRLWEGSFYPDNGTCNGQACVGPPRCAPQGHYTAELCVLKGVALNNQCVLPSVLDEAATAPTVCGTVAFDLPSTASLAVALGSSDAASRLPDGGAETADVLALVGNYTATASSGGITDGMGRDQVRFDSAPLALAPGTDSDLVVTTNPLPGDFPDSCRLPMQVTADAGGNLVLENRATTCSSDAATVNLDKGDYRLLPLAGSGKLRLAAMGTITGATGAAGPLAFAYSGEVVPAP
jgi:hypothetical protein